MALLIPAFGVAADAVTAGAWQRLHTRSIATLQAQDHVRAEPSPAVAGVEALSFSEFLLPAAEGGLEFTPRLRSLAGRRVRLAGYMVRQPDSPRGAFVLSPLPVTVDTQRGCFAAEIPTNAVHVHGVASQACAHAAYRPGRLEFTGVLEIGPRREADGRISSVRLILEDPTDLLVEVRPTKAIVTPSPPAP